MPIILLFLLSFNTWANFSTINATTLKTAIKNNITVIDIRRADEWERYGIIPNSHQLTFFDKNGNYNVAKWLAEFNKIVKNKQDKFVLVCAHAIRTKIVGNFLTNKLNYTNGAELAGGITDGWIAKKFKTIKLNNQI